MGLQRGPEGSARRARRGGGTVLASAALQRRDRRKSQTAGAIMPDVVILSAARTPIGSFQGALSSLPAPALGAAALKGAIERAGVAPVDIEQVYMGCVLPAGIGQAPARQ